MAVSPKQVAMSALRWTATDLILRLRLAFLFRSALERGTPAEHIAAGRIEHDQDPSAKPRTPPATTSTDMAMAVQPLEALRARRLALAGKAVAAMALVRRAGRYYGSW